ncbi:hypothetical protein ACLQ24_27150 [Micromonospora sp. DT4]
MFDVRVRLDPLAGIVGPLPVAEVPNLDALPLGCGRTGRRTGCG